MTSGPRPGGGARGARARYLVVGSPVAHSLSPAMMNAAFGAAGIPARYDAREIAADDWPAAMAGLLAEGIAGANVTVPHKEGALAGAAYASDTARAIGAANTLVRRGDGWFADNTDGPGFIAWVAECGARSAAEREALVLGAGGSAKAVVWALREIGCARVRIANRTAERAERIVAELGGGTGFRVEPPGGPAPPGGIVVNCTSVGLKPGDGTPVPAETLDGAAHVLDLVYPRPPLVREAEARGIAAADGTGMLVHQGVLAFERWTGVRPDGAVMRRAVAEEMERRAGGS